MQKDEEEFLKESDVFDGALKIYEVKPEEYYKKNYEMYQKNKDDIVCNWIRGCDTCKYYTHIGQLSYDDETIYGICKNHNCPSFE